jgi:hypothetical protein
MEFRVADQASLIRHFGFWVSLTVAVTVTFGATRAAVSTTVFPFDLIHFHATLLGVTSPGFWRAPCQPVMSLEQYRTAKSDNDSITILVRGNCGAMTVTEAKPKPNLRRYPLGPLLRYWMRHGVGLPTHLNLKAWTDALVQSAMIDHGNYADTDWIEGQVIGSSTLRSWANGNGFPEGKHWVALKAALTHHICRAVQSEWIGLLDVAWDNCRSFSKPQRIELYQRFVTQNLSQAPIIAYLQQVSEEEWSTFDTTAAARLHNTAPFIKNAIDNALIAQTENRPQSAIDILTNAINENDFPADVARTRLVVQAQMLRQRARIEALRRNFTKAIADFSLAIDCCSRADREMIASINRSVWAATACWIIECNDFADGKRALESTVSTFGAPSLVPLNALLSLAGDYNQGRLVFDDMIEAATNDATLKPNVITWNTLASKVASLVEAESCAAVLLPRGEARQTVFATLVGKVCLSLSGAELLTWGFELVKPFGFAFPASALESAIVQYRKSGRLDDALRLIMPFPFLPAARAFFQKSEYYQSRAEHYFLANYQTNTEAHHASYALVKLYEVISRPYEKLKWAKIASKFENQPPRRLLELSIILSASKQ